MKRRNFIAALAGVAVLRPTATSAQRPQRNVPLVGVVWLGTASAQISVRAREAFLRGLRENGYTEGQNIAIEDRYFGNSPDRLNQAADELVRLGVDVIVATGTQAALAAKRATEAIPIVGAGLADPVADGLVVSLARPGGNVTGNTFIGPELGPKRLQLLKEVFPGATRFAALQHPRVYSERTMQQMLSEMEEAVRVIDVDFQVFNASRPEDFDGAFEAMVERRIEALLLFPSPMFYVNYRRIVDQAARQRLPTMYYFREAVEGGGLMSYGAEILDLSRLAAKHVAKILKGTKPGDLPVEQPTKFELLINLKTSKALGLSVPPTLLARADEVIE
jgi:putative tryptophan/tyrosine transport system substrate-binding protein